MTCEYTDRSAPFGKYWRSSRFIFSFVPRALRAAEVDHDVGRQGEAFVIVHLLAAIPRSVICRVHVAAYGPVLSGLDVGFGVLIRYLRQLN